MKKKELEKQAWKQGYKDERHCGMSWLEYVQDFLIKLDIKPLMHLLEISNSESPVEEWIYR